MHQKPTPVSSPIRNDFFLDSPIIKSKQSDFGNNDCSSVYKIGYRAENKGFQNSTKTIVDNHQESKEPNLNKESNGNKVPQEKPKSELEQQRVDILAQKNKNNL